MPRVVKPLTATQINNAKPPISPNEKVYARMTCAAKPTPINAGDELDEVVNQSF